MSFRPLALVAAAALVAGVVACDDPFSTDAQEEVRIDTLSAFFVNGSPINAPAAVNLLTRSVVPVTSSFGFDVAFDLDEQGRVELIPAGAAAVRGQVPTHAVGIQLATGSFESVTEAPRDGYSFDSVKVVPVGGVAIVQAVDPVCSFAIRGQSIFAKLVIDSVAPSTGTVYFRLSSNPNCGFRSLRPGLPEN